MIGTLSPDQHATLRVLLSEYNALFDEYQGNYRQIEDARRWLADKEARQAQIQAEVHQLQAVGLKVGVDVFAAATAAASAVPSEARKEVEVIPEPSPSGIVVKDFVLVEAEKAFPNPVRASDLNAKLKELGYEVHPKTIGMSLYRWSVKKLIRREGADWFYVPKDGAHAPIIGEAKGGGRVS